MVCNFSCGYNSYLEACNIIAVNQRNINAREDNSHIIRDGRHKGDGRKILTAFTAWNKSYRNSRIGNDDIVTMKMRNHAAFL